MKGLQVLVAEDDALIGMLLADILEEMGHEVCTIESTEANAVTDAVPCQPDLISGYRSGVLARRPRAFVIEKPFREPDLACTIQTALAANVAL